MANVLAGTLLILVALTASTALVMEADGGRITTLHLRAGKNPEKPHQQVARLLERAEYPVRGDRGDGGR